MTEIQPALATGAEATEQEKLQHIVQEALASSDSHKMAEHAPTVAPFLCHEESVTRDAAVSFFELCGHAAVAVADSIVKNLSLADGRFVSACALALGHMQANEHAAEVAKLLSSTYVDTVSIAYHAAGLEPKLPVVFRRPACAAAFALALMGDDGAKFARDVAANFTDDLPADARACFISALGAMHDAESKENVVSCLEDSSAAVRAAAAEALGEYANSNQSVDIAAALAAKLKDAHPSVRQASVKALGKMPIYGRAYTDDILRLLTDRVQSVQISAVHTMAAMGEAGQMYAKQVALLLSSDGLDVRLAAMETLAAMGRRGGAFAEEVADLLEHESAEIRCTAVRTLASMKEDGSAFRSQLMAIAATDEVEEVREAADSAVSALH
mmetsp:Transcript_34490/g.78724  ORF Transcript_34490/g.78724 Transcript_34490/m.78724 type:complete len:385 (-) Transcript_34490:63-1217(-)